MKRICRNKLFLPLIRWRLGSCFRPLSTKEGQKKYDIQGKNKVRFEEFTPLGRSLAAGECNLTNSYTTFKLMSYNILAQTHMMTHIRNYKKCPRECLSWNYRKGILSHELLKEKPDVFCLQEVEGSHATDLLEPLRRLGYDALYVPRGEGKPDGCALLYNTTSFRIADFTPVLYFRPEMPLLDRPNVGMVARLELCKHPGNYITVAHWYIANTHFLYNQRRLDIKISQLQILLAETERLAFADNPDRYHPVIFTGDLNVNADTCLISLLRHRYVNCRNYNTRRWRTIKTSEGKELSVPDQLLQHYLNISPDCQYNDVVEGRKNGIRDVRKTEDIQEVLNDHRVFPDSKLNDPPKNEGKIHIMENNKVTQNSIVQPENEGDCKRRPGILRHGFPFIDVYEHPQLDRLQKNLSRPEPKQNVYDYIFYSGDLLMKHKGARFKPVKGQLQLLSRLRMPTVSEHKSHFSNLPNFACGSDHLPLCARFLLPVH